MAKRLDLVDYRLADFRVARRQLRRDREDLGPRRRDVRRAYLDDLAPRQQLAAQLRLFQLLDVRAVMIQSRLFDLEDIALARLGFADAFGDCLRD